MGKRNFREGNELRPVRKKNCVRECEILFFYLSCPIYRVVSMLKYSIVFKRRTYIMAGIFGKLFSEEQRELSALEKIADQVLKYEPEMQALSDDELRAKTDEY